MKSNENNKIKMILQSLCQMMQSSYLGHHENVVVVVVLSNDVSTKSAEQTILLTCGSVMFVHAPVSPVLVSHGWFSQ
jgi:hypothetical protein